MKRGNGSMAEVECARCFAWFPFERTETGVKAYCPECVDEMKFHIREVAHPVRSGKIGA
jgi:predicted amidophosphoribosyltransferase